MGRRFGGATARSARQRPQPARAPHPLSITTCRRALAALVTTVLILVAGLVLTPNRASATTVTSTDGKFRFTYRASQTSVTPGTTVTYRYELTNLTDDTWIFGSWINRSGHGTLTDDSCPGAASAAPSPAQGWLGDPVNGEYVAPGGTAWLECTTTVNSTVTSRATLSGLGYAASASAEPTPTSPEVTATETVTVSTSADYRLSGTVTPSPAAPGERVTYNATITNNGPVTGSTYRFTAALPSAFSSITPPTGCTVTDQIITCNDQPALAANASKTFTFSAITSTTPGDYFTNLSGYASNGGNPTGSINLTVAHPTTATASTDGDFTLDKKANRYSVPAGGAPVTYTYTVTNNSSKRQYYHSASDDECSPIRYISGLTRVYDSWFGRYFYYIPAGGKATFECSDTVTQTVTNTARFTFADSYSTSYYGYIVYNGASSATAKATVTRALPEGLDLQTCDVLWYASDERSPTTTRNGVVGVLDVATGEPTPIFDIGEATGDSRNGSAALVMDPANPNLLYFIVREGTSFSQRGKGLWKYDRATNQATLVESQVPDNGTAVTRLGIDPQGIIWTIGTSGTVYSLDPGASDPAWQNRGKMTLPSGLATTPEKLSSGDLTFDGNGTMYFISSDVNAGQRISYLFSLTQAELTDGSPVAKLAGRMGGSLGFNGLAFTADGTAYGTTGDSLYRVDTNTGAPTLIGQVTNELVSDLTSCALPKPLLQVTKTATPYGPLRAGESLTYSITVENLGALAATNVTLRDIPEGATITSVRLNDGNNLGASYLSTSRLINAPSALPGVIGPGQSATVTITTTVGSNRTQVCNQSHTTYEGYTGLLLSDDPSQPGGQDKTCNPVYDPAIAITKTADRDVLNGDGSDTKVTYTFEVRNAGNEPLKNIGVTDDKCGTPTYQGGDTDSDGLLRGSEVWRYVCSQTLMGTTRGGTSVRNTATAVGTATETGAVVNGSAMFVVTPPGLTFRKTSSARGAPVQAGDEIEYTITARNTTDPSKPLTGIVIRDSLPAGVTYVADSSYVTYPDGNSVRAGDPPNLVNGATLQPGERLTVTFRVRVDATSGAGAAQLTNTATADSDQTDETQDYVTDTVRRPYVEIRKFAGTMTGPDTDGRFTVTYTVQVSNSGPGDTLYGPITDQLGFAPDLQPVSATWTGASTGSTSLTSPGDSFTIGGASTSLPGGQDHIYDVEITFTHTGNSSVTECNGAGTGTYNTVSLPAGQEVGPTDDNSACVDPIAAFEVKKRAAGGASGGTGDPVTAQIPDGTDVAEVTGSYVITVTNTGLVSSKAPELTDAISVPQGFTVTRVTVNGTALEPHPADGRFLIGQGATTLAVGDATEHTVIVTARAATPEAIDWSAAGTCSAEATGGLTNTVTPDFPTDPAYAGALTDGDATNNSACVPFTPPTATITVIKTGSNCDVGEPTCPLAGASFELYEGGAASSGTPIPGGLTPNPGNNARFTSTTLTYFTPYSIVETQAPDGHTLLPEPITLSLTTAGITIAGPATNLTRVDSSTPLTLQVLDPTPAQLPATGGRGPWLPMALGAALLALGALLSRQVPPMNPSTRRLPRRRQLMGGSAP